MINKAYILTEDMRNAATDNQGRYQLPHNSCYILQQMEYSTCRCRQENGTPYNTSNMVVMKLTMQQSEDTSFQVFYSRLKENHSYSFSLLFDATMENETILKDYGSAMVFSGYVVDVEETFHGGLTTLKDKQSDELMQITVKVMLDNITYVGQTSDVTLSIYRNS